MNTVINNKSMEIDVWNGRLRDRKCKKDSIWLGRLRERVKDVSYKEMSDNEIMNDVRNEIELICKQSKNK